MEWYAIAMVVALAISTAATILLVGKRREPTSPGAALLTLVINGLFIWGVLALANNPYC